MELVKEIYNLIDNRQGENITVLDFRNNSPFLDYFLICTARNARLANSIIDEVEDYCSVNNINVISKSTSDDSGWFLIDIGSIVVHIFLKEERDKYNIEGLWKDLTIEI